MNAREMFNDLGYIREEHEFAIVYEDSLVMTIFDLREKEVEIIEGTDIVRIGMEELKAINQQVKELGWYV